jgi:uncharacterized protein YjbI with pentapeptide repeats
MADDEVSLRQACVRDVCGWLRGAWLEDRWRRMEPEAKQLASDVSRMLRLRLSDPESPETWCGLDFDLSRTIIRDLDLRGAHFTGGTVNFSGSIFGEPIFADLERPLASRLPDSEFAPFFALTRFSRGQVIFDNAIFLGNKQRGAANFAMARFDGASVSFRGAQFKGGQATFDDIICSAGTVDFSFAEFLDTHVCFTRAKLSAPAKIIFQDSVLSMGEMSFSGTEIRGGQLSLKRARIHGDLELYGMRIDDGEVILDSAQTSGRSASFRMMQIKGGKLSLIHWKAAGGAVRFNGTTLSQGLVTFDGALISAGEVFLDQMSIKGGTLSFAGVQIGSDALVRLPWGTYTAQGAVAANGGFDGKKSWTFRPARAYYDPAVKTTWGPFAPVGPAAKLAGQAGSQITVIAEPR